VCQKIFRNRRTGYLAQVSIITLTWKDLWHFSLSAYDGLSRRSGDA